MSDPLSGLPLSSIRVFEAATTHTLRVEALSTDGSTTLGDFTVVLGDEDEFDVTPITDTDGRADGISETAANGAEAGITAFAQDFDGSTHTVGYSLTDAAGVEPTQRAETVPIDGFVAMARELSNIRAGNKGRV